MSNPEVLQLNNSRFNQLRAVTMATLAVSIGGLATESTPAYAVGVDRAPINCPDAFMAQDPSSDPCNNQEDGTVITITDYNNYPAVDPGTKNTRYAYPNGDKNDLLVTSYGVRGTYTHANGTAPDTQTCNVTPADGSTIKTCATFDAEQITGGTGTGGGTTTPQPTAAEHTTACVSHAAQNYESKPYWSTIVKNGKVINALKSTIVGTPLSKYEDTIHCNDVDQKITRYSTVRYTVGSARKPGWTPLTRTAKIANPVVGREASKAHSAINRTLPGKALPCGKFITARYVTHAEAPNPDNVNTKISQNRRLKPFSFKLACK
jgi:hypothetical protein